MTEHATQDRVRRRRKLTECVPIHPDAHMGRAPARDRRNRWHILSDEIAQPLCSRRIADYSWDEDTFEALPADALVCRECHRKLSWQPLPHEYEMVDNGHTTLCKVWTRGVDSYGYPRRGKPEVRPHREMYEQTHGPIPEGYVLHHLCGVKACLEPTHVEAITRAEHALLHNEERGRGPGGEFL